MKSVLIFDLDNCLCPASAVGTAFLAPAFDAMRRTGEKLLEPAVLQAALDDCWHHSLDWVAERFQDALVSEDLDPGLIHRRPERRTMRIKEFVEVLRGGIEARPAD